MCLGRLVDRLSFREAFELDGRIRDDQRLRAMAQLELQPDQSGEDPYEVSQAGVAFVRIS